MRGADKVRDAFFLNDTTLIRSLPSRGERFRIGVRQQVSNTPRRADGVEDLTDSFATIRVGAK